VRIRIIAVVAALGLLLSAGIATANDDESTPRGDTLFNFGYDPQAQLFLHGTTDATESSVSDCSLANGTLTVTYADPDEGIIPVGGVSADCGVSAVSVGVNGHINHGTFMKLFNELIDMQGRGCLNRWLAQSQLGKNEQHVRNTDFVVAEIAAAGDIDFETAIASCDRGKKDKPEDHPGRGHGKEKTNDGEGNAKGRPTSPGKSAEAPGHNKDS
jgi:hypothetical protein